VNVTGSTDEGLVLLRSDWNVTGSLAIGGTSASAGGAGRLAIGKLNKVDVGSNLKIWPGGALALRESGAFTINGAANLGGALEFLLGATTNPQLDNQFTILSAAGGVTGAFSSTMLPPLGNGLAWIVLYNPTSVALKVVSAASFTADFDDDGDVDSGDLVQWQGDFGVNALSDADADGDSDGADFLAWQQQLGSGPPLAPVGAVVPEPSCLVLLAMACVARKFDLTRRRLLSGKPYQFG
jgi:hypothetical protein